MQTTFRNKSQVKPLSRQRGFMMVVFVLIVGMLGLSIVLGYSGQLAREESNARPVKLNKIIAESRDNILTASRKNFAEYDKLGGNNSTTLDQLVIEAGVLKRFGMEVEWSRPMPTAKGLSRRFIAIYFPTNSDGLNPPDMESFKQTGEFVSCKNPSMYCDSRVFTVFDTLSIQEEALLETTRRLTRVAQKAQTYFKARMLQDPETNVSVNYFRPLSGRCNTIAHDLPCMDDFTPIAADISGNGWEPIGDIANTLGLTGNELISAWGKPFEISNAIPEGQNEFEPPFVLEIRAEKPAISDTTGFPFEDEKKAHYIVIKAIQQF